MAPLQLMNPDYRLARAYFCLCLYDHCATDVFELANGEQAHWYLARAFDELENSWPELHPMFGIASAPLNEPMASQLLQALHAASGSWSAGPLDLRASRGLQLLQTWVTATNVRNMLGSKPS